MLKLKLSRPTAPADAPANEAPTPTSTTSTSGPKLSFKIKNSSAPTAEPADGPPTSTEQPKQKRKYNKKPKGDENSTPKAPTLSLKPSKKRLRDDNGDEDSPAAKRKPKPTAKSLAFVKDEDMDDDAGVELVQRAPRPQPVRQQSMKLSFKPKGASSHKVIPLLKVKGAGKPPARPPGVGYDSEAEEAEIDPAIESQFILRMQPGDDCDLLRKSIEEKTIGKPSMQGGPGVNFRFFDREGRRAMITIQGRYYAATMVELPCVVESMKSWNKKDWVKTADVCQMLLVLGRVANEDEAKKFPLPREINNSAHQYPHGLTPPMHWARKRRFRPRISYHRIEQVEEETEAQLAADRIAKDKGGRTEFEIIDAFHSDSESSSEEDAEGEVEEMYDAPQYGEIEGETPAAEAVDDSVLEEMLAAGFMEDDEADGEGEVDGEAAVEPDAVEPDMDDLFGDGGMEAPETPATSHDVAMHALGETSNIGIETAASTPAADTDSPDADDDDESDDDDEIDEEAAAKQQQIEEIQAEIRELDQNIAGFISQRDTQKNVLMKERYQAKVDKQVADRDINLGKLRALGVEVD